jgi:hypothetical protein
MPLDSGTSESEEAKGGTYVRGEPGKEAGRSVSGSLGLEIFMNMRLPFGKCSEESVSKFLILGR